MVSIWAKTQRLQDEINYYKVQLVEICYLRDHIVVLYIVVLTCFMNIKPSNNFYKSGREDLKHGRRYIIFNNQLGRQNWKTNHISQLKADLGTIPRGLEGIIARLKDEEHVEKFKDEEHKNQLKDEEHKAIWR